MIKMGKSNGENNLKYIHYSNPIVLCKFTFMIVLLRGKCIGDIYLTEQVARAGDMRFNLIPPTPY